MGFDLLEYTSAMDELVLILEGKEEYEFIDGSMQHTLERICTLLDIARLDALTYKSIREEEAGNGKVGVFYQNGSYDPSRTCSIRELPDDGMVVNYRAYQNADAPAWDSETVKHINVFLKLLFSFQGRARVMGLAEKLVFRDKGLGIYNLPYMLRSIGQLISENRVGEYCACYFNLSRFHYINKNIGRNNGNEVMAKYARSLQKKIGEDDIVCRIGGDNFAVLFRREYKQAVIEHMEGVSIEYSDKGDKVVLSANAGLYDIPDSCTDPYEIMDAISTAVSIAKVNRKNYVEYDEEMRRNQEEIKNIEASFTMALENEEFLVYYQPKVRLKDYKLAGGEALCRWFHNGELIPPGKFIPVLEQSQAICSLDFYMLEHVCRDLRRWLDEGNEVVKISVNLSRLHLGNDGLLERILSILNTYNIPHEYIEIELTETTTDVDYDELKKIVNGLRNEGVSTSVDDFGMGYSSLKLIRELPWNVLKIDKSFLPDGDNQDMQKQIMLKYVVAMSQDMGLECIVEGVETVEQIKLLKENNCYLAQGFYFDRPLPVEEFEKRLKGQQ